jgi:hypothetical protein
MIGTPNDPQLSSDTKAIAKRARDRALQVKVALPTGNDSASRRLARKIQHSLSRTLASEPGARLEYTIVGAGGAPADPAPAAQSRSNAAQHAAPGCGAWWNF